MLVNHFSTTNIALPLNEMKILFINRDLKQTDTATAIKHNSIQKDSRPSESAPSFTSVTLN